MMRILPFVAALLLCTPAGARTLVDRVVAVVGDDVVLLSEVNEVMRFGFEQELQQIVDLTERESQRRALQLDILDQVIAERLISQAIVGADIHVSEGEVEAQVDRIAESNGLSREQLGEALKREGMSFDGYRAELKEQMERQRFVGMEISSRVFIDDEQVRLEYERLKREASKSPKLQLQRLRVAAKAPETPSPEVPPKDGPEDPQPATPPIEAVLADLAAGIDFDSVARKYSDLPGASEGGSDMPALDPADLADAFAAPIRKLEVGQVSAPITTGDSVWMFKLISIETVEFASLDDLTENISENLWQTEVERQIDRWVERKRAKAHVEIKL